MSHAWLEQRARESTDEDQLRRMAYDATPSARQVRLAVAENTATPLDSLLALGMEFPREVLDNPGLIFRLTLGADTLAVDDLHSTSLGLLALALPEPTAVSDFPTMLTSIVRGLLADPLAEMFDEAVGLIERGLSPRPSLLRIYAHLYAAEVVATDIEGWEQTYRYADRHEHRQAVANVLDRLTSGDERLELTTDSHEAKRLMLRAEEMDDFLSEANRSFVPAAIEALQKVLARP